MSNTTNTTSDIIETVNTDRQIDAALITSDIVQNLFAVRDWALQNSQTALAQHIEDQANNVTKLHAAFEAMYHITDQIAHELTDLQQAIASGRTWDPRLEELVDMIREESEEYAQEIQDDYNYQNAWDLLRSVAGRQDNAVINRLLDLMTSEYIPSDAERDALRELVLAMGGDINE